MDLQHSIHLDAPPDDVYAFLLDANRVVACVPGAQLGEVTDPDHFQGKVRLKVGPVSVGYAGTAAITGRDPVARTAVLEAHGREAGGQGSVRASSLMTVTEDGSGSRVTFATELAIAGRVARFGRGVIEDVSRQMLGIFADNVRAALTAPSPAAEPAGPGSAPGSGVSVPVGAAPLHAVAGAAGRVAGRSAPGLAAVPSPGAPDPRPTGARPLSALTLLGLVLRAWLRRWRRSAAP